LRRAKRFARGHVARSRPSRDGKAYACWAPIYDALCGPVFVNGRRAAARAARDVGGCILEIGVGTGLSFDDYDAHTEIAGIDISKPMIARARARGKERPLSVRQGTRGDGCACAGLR
jgi:SAM-dependent methyltransferase